MIRMSWEGPGDKVRPEKVPLRIVVLETAYAPANQNAFVEIAQLNGAGHTVELFTFTLRPDVVSALKNEKDILHWVDAGYLYGWNIGPNKWKLGALIHACGEVPGFTGLYIAE
jgi:hypothetical protein